MIIKRKFKNNLCVCGDIETGEVFRLENGSSIFMKICNVTNRNAVDLETGSAKEIRENQNCILIPKAKISVTIADNIDIHD